jgi:hypothetical protein
MRQFQDIVNQLNLQYIIHKSRAGGDTMHCVSFFV